MGKKNPKPKKVVYTAVHGARINKEQAARYGSRITHLAEENGFITPRLVVDDARNPASPLHDYFDWNNKEAAEKWRIEQAKYLIRTISITVIDEKRPEIRQFYSITSTPEMDTEEPQVYVTLNTILTDKEKRQEVIAYALRELRGWTERYRQYSELHELIGRVDSELERF